MDKVNRDFISMEANATAVNMRHQHSANANNSTSPTQKDTRLLRCFCGCSQLTYEQIENILMMNVNGIVTNPVSNNLFKTFLKIGHRSDEAIALRLVKRFELADKMSQNLSSYKDFLEALINLCPPFWELRLIDACNAPSPETVQFRLNEELQALKAECLCNIGADRDFDRFKKELLRKIGKK